MPLAAGQVSVPVLSPGVSVDLVVILDRKIAGQSGNFDISLLRSAALEHAEATVSVKSHTPETVTISVAAAKGLAGGGVVFVLCSS